MAARLAEIYERLGRVDKLFAVALLGAIALRWFAPLSGFAPLLTLLAYILGIIVLFRLARRAVRKTIWRLRNRLIVAYLFIALVPVALIVALTGMSIYWVTGQIAGYLINSELQRRTAALKRPAEALARMPAANRPDFARRMQPFMSGAFPEVAVLIRDSGEYRFPPDADIAAPPPEWKDASGIVVKDGRLYSWAHAVANGVEVTLMAPLTRELLGGLVPGLGVVELITGSGGPPGASVRVVETRSPRKDRIPPPFIAADVVVTGFYPVPYSAWERPGRTENGALFIQTRTSAVLGQVFGHNIIFEKVEWGEAIWWSFLAISGLFLIVELISLVIGISITRTVTTAVNDLYEGTQRIKEGDFSHRIPVHGDDQLAELGLSFNNMTASLERLIVVAKEKERLQSELEIAREVQNQLFPKALPDLKTLQMAGLCNPARMVSGDYYDFMQLPDASLAFAIGDVAGKGISAALLMAAIQSAMRSQLTTVAPMAVAAGNGGSRVPFSTARLVSLLNRQLYANTSPEKYATFYFALYEEDTNILTYTNAGHLPPILVHNGNPHFLEVTGTVVGAFPFAEYGEKRIQLEPGDLLVSYTDGIVEPENEYGEMFGDDRLKEVLAKHGGRECREIIARVMEAVAQWTGAGELQDDMTMLVARRI